MEEIYFNDEWNIDKTLTKEQALSALDILFLQYAEEDKIRKSYRDLKNYIHTL